MLFSAAVFSVNLHVPINPILMLCFVLQVNAAVTECTGKNNLKPDLEKLRACAFVPCPMATCALKCLVVSIVNPFAFAEYLPKRWRLALCSY